MAVTIDLELQAGDAEAEILGIATALRTLDDAGNDIDIGGDINVGKVTGKVGDIVDELNKIGDAKIFDFEQVNETLDRIERLQDGNIQIARSGGSSGGGGGGGGGGGSTDGGGTPDEKTLSRRQVASKIESIGGFDRGSVEIQGDWDTDSLKRMASNIENTTRNLTTELKPWIKGSGGDGNLQGKDLGKAFLGEDDPSTLDWPELQSRAGDLGVYESKSNMRSNMQQMGPLEDGWYRKALERRVRNHTFNSRGIAVDTDSHGKVPFRKAARVKSGAHTFPDSDALGDGFSNFSTVDAGRFKRNMDKIPSTDARDIDYDAGGILPTFGDRDKDRDLSELNGNFKGIGGYLRKLKPTMGKYMQLLAAFIPVAVALGTQLLGVAAAMGSVAVAGGALMGLGLFGHAESMSGSIAEAKNQMRELKREMFQAAQPTMQQFAPIQSRMFDAMPGGIRGIAESMEGLAAFEDTVMNIGGALAGGIREFFNIITQNESTISQLTKRFGGLIGVGLLDFFEFLIQSASKNQELLVSMGGSILKLAVVGYNLALALTRILSAFKPVINMMAWMSGLLNNKLLVGLLTFITISYATTAALMKMGSAALFALSKIGLIGSKTFVGQMVKGFMAIYTAVTGLIAKYTTLTGAALTAASAMAMTGVGLLAVGAGALAADAVMDGMSGSPAASGSRGRVVEDNRTYNITMEGDGNDWANQQAMKDTVNQVNETNAAERPPGY